MSNTVIKIEHLSKMYKLGIINNGALFRDIQSWWALKRGKEDPHSQIGEDKYLGSDTEFWALKDLTFDIKQGDRVGIIGKNGAGKSTLLKVLSRITTPTEGLVKIKGKVSSLLEVGTGFHGELTGRENIYLNGAILGMKKSEIDRKLDEIIDFSGIEKHIDTPVKRYSSGMYVRLAFAVAAHLDSDILIADEVLAVGDAEFQKKAIGKMSELSTGQGRTVLFVSHNMAAVKSLCNKGVILEKGRLKFENNSIDKVIEEYQTAGSVDTRQSEWINNGDLKSIFFTPEKMYIINSNGEKVNSFTRDEKNIRFVIEADIKENNPLLNFGISFINSGGQVVFTTWVRDINMDTSFQLGKSKFLFQIPNSWLNIGKYKALMSGGLHHVSYIINPGCEPFISFDVSGSIGTDFGDDVRSGCVLPMLQWSNMQ
ncbi:ABC transporter ATP-binding protein [Treponema sp. OMZ 792]|uniref:ABC transporter ATP-binding protein n=1 Tax=unclassified Treponema TaxID=2638727 RepID=UPI0020A47D04|nr:MULTISPECIES: ABC transporter ATP-binding protein [unclassified Treponema]UTC76297.1 ABC transporter ATP-binding protein [Treponema sp. OMZ 792]UTC76308.1 ABC transporter ATP-binding protein [Treponema sp. OMZ 792]UTC80302.1 ABC transporter ATP-binding protein [Treponema sp. OMZ 798]